MTASTPSDLAVTFRSLGRRQREAIGDADPAPLAGLLAELDGHVAAAASAVGTSGGADAVATAIERRRHDEWDDATLTALRDAALAAGAVLRRLADAAADQG
jgi:hypothetical protein